MYITVTNDDNKYYRTWTSGQTNIEGCKCILCDVLPEVEFDKKQFCKLKESIETTYETIIQPVLDKNGEIQYTEPELDEEGNIIKPSEMITETVKFPNKKTIYSWEFDEDAYNNYQKELEEKNNKPSEMEKIRADIDFLAMEMGVEL